MKWIVSASAPPPNRGTDHWVRAKDPWHREAFPAQLRDQAPNQTNPRTSGWMSEDWCGNPESFVPDGTEVTNGY